MLLKTLKVGDCWDGPSQTRGKVALKLLSVYSYVHDSIQMQVSRCECGERRSRHRHGVQAFVHEPECTVSPRSHIMSGIVSVVGCYVCIQRSMMALCRVIQSTSILYSHKTFVRREQSPTDWLPNAKPRSTDACPLVSSVRVLRSSKFNHANPHQ